MYLSGRIKEVIWCYFKKNFLLYLITILVFSFGVMFGAIAVKALTLGQKSELTGYLTQFFTSLDTGTLAAKNNLARQALLSNLKTIVLIWLMGITVVGIPLVIAIVFTKGFVIGFTVGFLAQEMVIKGIVFAIAAIIPHNLLAIPALIMASTAAISFSALLIREKFLKKKHNLKHCFAGYFFFSLGMATVFVLASLVEAYITPVFMKILSSYLI